MNNEQPKACYVFSPGEYVADELKCRGLTREAFADGTGMTLGRVNGIIDDDHVYTAAEAKQIAVFFGTSERLWINLQTSRFAFVADQLAAAIRDAKENSNG